MPDSLSTTISSASPRVSDLEIEAVDRSLIDASVRTPVMFFFTTAQTWLLAATVLGFICSIKLHWPTFLGDWSFMTYGRLWPAYTNILVYGWGLPAGIGTAIWMTARLCRVELRSPWIPIISGIFWNIGVTVGVIAVLAGNMQPYELLEFPRQASVLLFIAYSLIGAWGIVMFQNRRPGHIYISLWYFVGAYFWFPWLYASANLMVGSSHVTGVVHAAIAAWYAQGLMGYFFASVGLGAIYYLIPKVIGRPIVSYNLALLGFWSFEIFWGLTGMVRFTGGPFPVWYSSLSIAALILLLVPVGTVAVNILMTMKDDTHMVYHSPTIRFTMYGTVAWIIGMLVTILGSVREMDPETHFTQFSTASFHLLVYAFFSMTMFGAMYYIVPRLVGCEWLSATFIRLHFWGSAYGIGLMIVMMVISGIAQGWYWNNPALTSPAVRFFTPVEVLAEILPYLRGESVAWIPLGIAHLLFFVHFIAMLLRLGQPSGEPTLFAPITEGEAEH
jgi:cytochrome c oxidase cbb3-type subunit I